MCVGGWVGVFVPLHAHLHQAIEPVCTVLFRSVENINMAKELPPYYYNLRSYVAC